MTNQTTAQAATEPGALPQGELSLLGTFTGTEPPRALILTRTGKTETVTLGDRVARARVVAIEEGRIILQQNGASRSLSMPQGGGQQKPGEPEEHAQSGPVVTG